MSILSRLSDWWGRLTGRNRRLKAVAAGIEWPTELRLPTGPPRRVDRPKLPEPEPKPERTDPRRPQRPRRPVTPLDRAIRGGRTRLKAALRSTRLQRAFAEQRTTEDQQRRLLLRLVRDGQVDFARWARQLNQGHLSPAAWHRKMKAGIADLASAVAMAGTGTNRPDAELRREIGRRIADQHQYLDGFREAIDDGQLSAKQIRARAQAYAKAAWGVAQGVRHDQAIRAGYTFARRRLGLSVERHCPDCPKLAAEGWMPIAEMVPIGATVCKFLCRCTIEYAAGETPPGEPVKRPPTPPLKPDSRREYPAHDYRSLGVEFVRSDRAKDHRYAVVLVDVARFDAAWSHDAGYYIPPAGGGAEIAGRRRDFEAFLKRARDQGIAVRMSEPYSGMVQGQELPPGFLDGRHRFTVLRDMGIKYIPMAVERADLPAFVERFAYRGDLPKGRLR